ncbi:hypothetical protein GOEFS_119_00240 [Gordonia effusa NBRC 100432]|uniref:Uncharacterized protein n=2 Tax=Gordonia effusa TaxID=263908 RepID=H0R633_9ACTN|nr:hypothetical protein GOEFS_119_00240 [Gordonia effusa NBRC 100432]
MTTSLPPISFTKDRNMTHRTDDTEAALAPPAKGTAPSVNDWPAYSEASITRGLIRVGVPREQASPANT